MAQAKVDVDLHTGTDPLRPEDLVARLTGRQGLVCLIPDTIDAAALRAMRKTAHLINTARGPVVDEEALFQALSEKWIAGAGLHVFEHEVHPGLIAFGNIVLAPHVASASRETRLQMAMLAVENCLAVLEGRPPPTPVNPEALSARTA